MEIVEKINPKCLSIDDDRVFVSYTNEAIRTATKHFYRCYKTNMFVTRLYKPLSIIPRKGTPLRITNWHYALPIKIEMKIKEYWQMIYELKELPSGLRCLVDEHKEN